MKIALISYEYPPDTAFGGIATYTLQIAQLMQQRGHRVEVFAGSAHRQESVLEYNILVHRVRCQNRADFVAAVAPVFATRHQEARFEVVESPEIGAESQGITTLVPEVPLVVKLHTPTYLIRQVNYVPPTVGMQVRRVGGALRRGQRPSLLSRPDYDPETDPERTQTLKADLITTPSQALGQALIETWQLNPDRLRVVPNPYLPTPDLLDIPVATQTNRVTFIGRLEVRKGVLELAAAIPQILRHHPDTQFRFVGAAWPAPVPGLAMDRYLLQRLHRHRGQLEFTGSVPLTAIPNLLAETDICVFPSRWENFPGVCLEAMAAARGIVGSTAGGMVDMLDRGAVGRLVNPQNPQAIATAVSELLHDPALRRQLGRAARDRILTHYNLATIGQLQEHIYREAIERHHPRQGQKTDRIAGMIANAPTPH
jgi:glycosyltransferase involved in cell wall biosynthesis